MPVVAKQTAGKIDLDAADWAARVDRGLSPAEERDLDLWLSGDSRRVGAYGRVRAVSLHTERARALGPDFDRAQFRPRPAPAFVNRRRLLFAGGGALAAGFAGIGAVSLGLRDRGERYATSLGEVIVVPFADGSVMTLNTASVAKVHFSDTVRSVRLLEGEALFDVAKDSSRPFLVGAGDALVRAVGTSFTVLRLGTEPVQVLVRAGVVEISRRAQPRGARPVRVAANSRAIASTTSAAIAATIVPPAAISRELAWREGRLVFGGETLLEAANQFARYSSTRIVIDDPTVAAEPITGLFQANDPVGFARSVAASFNLRAEVGAGEVRLYR